ncbi:MAG: hypothetical protein ACOY45_14185 [Pseudomonadota bacterium]
MSLINEKFYGALGNEPRRAEDDSPFDALMHHLCVDMGYCGGMVDGVPMHATDLLPASGVVTADSFADLVMRADGVLCAEHPHFRRAFAMPSETIWAPMPWNALSWNMPASAARPNADISLPGGNRAVAKSRFVG